MLSFMRALSRDFANDQAAIREITKCRECSIATDIDINPFKKYSYIFSFALARHVHIGPSKESEKLARRHESERSNTMQRIQPIQVTEAPAKSRQLLESVQQAMGMVPNLMKTLAQSPAALAGYLNLNQALGGALTGPLREQIALAVAGINGCDYCASAHCAIGAKVGVNSAELAANLHGDSQDGQTRAALKFAGAVVEKRGEVSDGDLDDVRAAGYGDSQIAEIVAVVALNIFTNYFNHVAATEIDFPVVDTAGASV
jgi:uncharacterized peroxidase-related enzyme